MEVILIVIAVLLMYLIQAHLTWKETRKIRIERPDIRSPSADIKVPKRRKRRRPKGQTGRRHPKKRRKKNVTVE